MTPEESVLAIFGREASSAVSELLSEAGITVLTGAAVEVPAAGAVVVNPGDLRLTFDRVVALPELVGPAIRGYRLAMTASSQSTSTVVSAASVRSTLRATRPTSWSSSAASPPSRPTLSRRASPGSRELMLNQNRSSLRSEGSC